MKHRILPALSLATLLLACAHDPNKREVKEARAAENETQRERADNSARDEAFVRGDQSAEQTDLPRRRAQPKRLASADDKLPAERERDRETAGDERAGDDKLTALDQGNGEIDLDLTQRIRKAVMAEDSLSFGAKNVKIITKDGHVTLRGEVNSAAEKETIYKCAVSAAGTGHVTNQIEIDAD